MARSEKIEVNAYRFWAARFWHGMLFSAWVRLLIRNRFRVGLLRIPLATTITTATIFNSCMRPVQRLLLSRRVARTKIKEAPIFIIGHWRSGTTMLHELLVLDDRYTFPTTYQCFVPNHFLVTKWFVTKMWFLLPRQRPMDNMLMGWDRPQEDEFALCNMGLPSPYLTMAFPNEAPHYPEYLDLNIGADELARWQAALLDFLRHVTYRTPKRIILKSPSHTSRIKAILEMFPDARFVHIVRDPYALYSSTIKLWKTLYKFQALQEPNYRGLEEYVYACFEQMYSAFERERDLIPHARLYEVRYEDLTKDTFGEMKRLYESLELGEFERVQPKLEEYLAGTRDYKPNKHEVDSRLRAEVDRRWGRFMRRYGYCQPAAAAEPA